MTPLKTALRTALEKKRDELAVVFARTRRGVEIDKQAYFADGFTTAMQLLLPVVETASGLCNEVDAHEVLNRHSRNLGGALADLRKELGVEG